MVFFSLCATDFHCENLSRPPAIPHFRRLVFSIKGVGFTSEDCLSSSPPTSGLSPWIPATLCAPFCLALPSIGALIGNTRSFPFLLRFSCFPSVNCTSWIFRIFSPCFASRILTSWILRLFFAVPVSKICEFKVCFLNFYFVFILLSSFISQFYPCVAQVIFKNICRLKVFLLFN